MVSRKKKNKKTHQQKPSFIDRILGRDTANEDVFDTYTESDEGELYDEEVFDEDFEENTEEDEMTMPTGKESDHDLQINLIDKGKKLIAQAIVPGVNEDQIDINLNREMLTITTNSNSHCVEKGGDYLYEELAFGSFSRSILLPAEIDVDEADAEVKDGVLTVTMTKIDRAAQKKLGVKKK